MLQVENLSKAFGSRYVVKDVSFEVQAGHVTGFLGQNGAGKSTVMNMIAGYLTPSAGRILLNGQDKSLLGNAYKREIGYLPEIPPLYPDLTVQEYLQFVCGLKQIKRNAYRQHIGEVCELTGIQDHRERLIRHLSKGFKQRVGIAQALIGNPSLLILDEPTVGLDPKQIVGIRELIRALSREHAVILSSHILREVEDICDHIAILRKGHIVTSGTTAEIAASHQQGHRFRLRLRGEGSQKVLEKLPGLEALHQTPSVEANYMDFTLQTHEDVTPQLLALLCEANCELRMLFPLDVELEDIFLRLTQDEGEE